MPRNLSAAAKSYSGPVAWLAAITLPAAAGSTSVYLFADQQGVFAGQSYEPLLRVTQGPRFSRTLAADYGEIELVANPNLTSPDLVSTSPIPFERFEGGACVLSQHLIGLDEAVIILRGRLTELEESDAGFKFRIVSDLDAAQIQVHPRSYASLCTWPFRRALCGYENTSDAFTEHLAERTATSADLFSIADSALALTANEHKDRTVLLSAGTGRGQLRRIRSNSATALTVWSPFDPVPDTSTKFKVFSFTGGASKPLWTAAGSADLSRTGTPAPRSYTDAGLDLVADEHKDDLLVVGGQSPRRIQTNSATVITIADDEPDLIQTPSVVRVRFRRCPKDFSSCERRARTEAHNGFPTLVPLVSQAAGEPPVIPPGVIPPGFGGGPGGGGGIPL